MMQPKTICMIAAMLFSGAMNSAIGQTASPSTPPTHPTTVSYTHLTLPTKA